MRGAQQPASRLTMLVALGLSAATLLACIIPSGLARNDPPPAPTSQPFASPSAPPSAMPGTAEVEVRISEQDLNQRLQDARASLGDGMDLGDMRLKVDRGGIRITGSAQLAQLQGARVPVDILLRPVVHGEQLDLEVVDIKLGGSYASYSGLVKPLVSAGIANGFDVDQYLDGRDLRVSGVDLQEGFVVIKCVPRG